MRPTRSRSYERQARQTEFLLLLVVLTVLAAGGFLLLLAKVPPTGGSGAAAPVNVNATAAPQIARALGVPANVAARVVEARARQSGRNGFGDVDALKRLRLVAP